MNGFVDRTVNQSFENVVIFCNATGNPLPKITWKLGNEKIDGVGYLDDVKACNIRKQGFFFLKGMRKNRLAICDMSYKKHEGTYTCIASNIVSSVSVSMKVHIYCEYLSKPDFALQFVLCDINKLLAKSKCITGINASVSECIMIKA